MSSRRSRAAALSRRPGGRLGREVARVDEARGWSRATPRTARSPGGRRCGRRWRGRAGLRGSLGSPGWMRLAGGHAPGGGAASTSLAGRTMVLCPMRRAASAMARRLRRAGRWPTRALPAGCAARAQWPRGRRGSCGARSAGPGPCAGAIDAGSAVIVAGRDPGDDHPGARLDQLDGGPDGVVVAGDLDRGVEGPAAERLAQGVDLARRRRRARPSRRPRRAASTRWGSRSVATTADAPDASASRISSRPMGPAPNTPIVSPGRSCARRMRVDGDAQRLEHRAGHVVDGVGERHQPSLWPGDQLAHGAVGGAVAEEPDARAQVRQAAGARVAAAARDVRVDRHPLAGPRPALR